MRRAGAPLYRLSNLSRSWKRIQALKDVSIEIRAGEVVLLVGPSGSGKSTLLRTLVGGLRPTSGRFEVDGTDIDAMSARDLRRFQAGCSVVEQGSLLIPQLTVHRNVLAGRLATWPWYRVLWSTVTDLEVDAVRRQLEEVDLADRLWEITANLSGGQQQRVAIARALISSPRVILADEPIASLDSANASHATALLVDTARRTNATIVFCTHFVSLVLPFVDRVIGIRDGRVAIDRAAGEVSDRDFAELYDGNSERR